MVDDLLITTSHGGKFEGGDDVDAVFTVASLSDWFESPGVRQDRRARPLADGYFPSPVFREGKLPAWEGLILTRTMSEQLEAIESLGAYLGGTTGTRLTVEASMGTTSADAVLDDKPSVEILHAGRVAKYRVRMFVESGFRYGSVNRFASGEAAYHLGTSPAVPSFTVTGTMPSGYAIQSSFGTFTVTQALASGQTHRISLADGWVYRNGVLQSGATAHPRRLWRIPAGQRITHTLVPVSGSGTLTVKVPDTF